MSFETDRSTPAWFLFVDIDPPLRLWTGFGDYPLSSDEVDKLGGNYKGGIILAWPRLRFPINGTSAIETFPLSGVRQEAIRLVADDAEQLDGAIVNIGLLELINGQPAGNIAWVLDGVANSAQSQCDPVTGRGQIATTATVNLQIVTGEVDRKHSTMSNWTGAEQRRRYPGDAFCDRTSIYDIGTSQKWP
jgi:hypothetical protein